MNEPTLDPQTTPASDHPAISVVIPVRNGASMLSRCLEALRQSRGVDWECIVVDDGSTDDSVGVARRLGARILRAEAPGSGPGRARNLGAAEARAPLLFFVDADVLVRPDTLAEFVALFEENPSIAAAFGSYDTQPAERNLLSQYRNLLHHFVHQSGQASASTFWSGCGAIRRPVFLASGGFDPSYGRPSIEDIELGYRLRAGGHEIRLAKHIQVTHLKHWRFWSILRTDIFDRALPWTELIHRSGYLPNDLNLSRSDRVSAVCVVASPVFLVAGFAAPFLWLVCCAALVSLLYLNRSLYRFFLEQRGLWFLLRVLPMHWLYYAYSSLAFAWGTLLAHRPRQITASSSSAPEKSTLRFPQGG